MKKISKILALVVALVMVFAMSAMVFADGETYKITIDNAAGGETYSAYKIFDVTYSNPVSPVPTITAETSIPGAANETHFHNAYAYTITTSSEWWSVVTGDPAGTTPNDGSGVIFSYGLKFTPTTTEGLYNVEPVDGFNVADFAAVLNGAKSGKTVAASATPDGEDIVSVELDVTSSGAGYYFVDTSLGSLCSLDTTEPNAVIREKNSYPSVDKTQKTTGDDYADDSLDVNIGDTVHYQIEVTDGTGTDADIKLTDSMSPGQDYVAGSMKINGTSVADDADTDNWKVTVTTGSNTITIEFKAAYVATIDVGGTITVTYDTTVNEEAVVDDDDGNGNMVTLEYSAHTEADVVYWSTYDFVVKKTDGSSFLDGAGFKLYDDETGGNQITVAKDDTGYYVDADSDEEIMVTSADGANVRGLAPGTYYLEETTVPDGYNKLAARTAVTITSGATAPVEITVVNNAGSVLPSTGGIGVTILYIVGAALVVGAGVILVVRRKMAAK